MQTSKFWLRGEALDGRNGHEAGRQLLEKLYRDVTGQVLPEIRIAEGGKPYFPDNPFYFSISHTKAHVFCCLSQVPVGIDAEEQDREINLALAEKILSLEEKIQFDTAPDPREALLKFWVLKEAAAKRSGKGLQGYPNHTQFSLMDSRIQILEGCFVAVLTQERNEESYAI